MALTNMLPVMKSDIVLSHGKKKLIIDAKYYSKSMQTQFDVSTVRSNNLYQIFTYVKNKEAELVCTGEPHEVSGMLLYAGTDEAIQPDATYLMSGNRISVKTLDIDRSFDELRAQLDGIAREWLGKSAPFDCSF